MKLNHLSLNHNHLSLQFTTIILQPEFETNNRELRATLRGLNIELKIHAHIQFLVDRCVGGTSLNKSDVVSFIKFTASKGQCAGVLSSLGYIKGGKGEEEALLICIMRI